MNKKQNNLNLSDLPDHAQIQLVRFYNFLCIKYGVLPEEKGCVGNNKRFSEFFEASVKVDTLIHYSRDELHDRKKS